MHQTVIGIEAMAQMEMAGEYPDIIFGCTGGGSNFAGCVFPFIGEQLRGGRKVAVTAVEPAACPSLTKGKYAYDFGDTAMLTPLTKMHTLGSSFTPPGFHAGGLRYHGMAPLVSHLKKLGPDRRAGLPPDRVLRGRRHVRPRRGHRAGAGIQPRREGRHRRGAAVPRRGRSRVILFSLSGHGHFDMGAYTDYFTGKLQDLTYDEADLAMALAGLPSVNE